MTRIEAVTFDLDDTLVRYERPPGEVLQAAFERCDLDPLFPVEAYYDRYREFAAKTDSMTELRSECFATLARERGHDPALAREVATAFDQERDQSSVELLSGAAEVLDTLGERYRLAIVTNGARDAQRAKIEAVDLERWVETVVIAGQNPPPKPDPAPFEMAMDALGVRPETTVHVGDSPDSDVTGANALGMASVLFADGKGPGEPEPTYRIDSLAALPSLLG